MEYKLVLVLAIVLFLFIASYSFWDVHTSMFTHTNWMDVENLRKWKSELKKIKKVQGSDASKVLQHKVDKLNENIRPIIKYYSRNPKHNTSLHKKGFRTYYSKEDQKKLKEIKKLTDIIEQLNSYESDDIKFYEREIEKVSNKKIGKLTVGEILKREKKEEDFKKDKNYIYKS